MKLTLHKNAKRRARGLTKYQCRNLWRWLHRGSFGWCPWAQGRLRATRMPKGGYQIVVSGRRAALQSEENR